MSLMQEWFGTAGTAASRSAIAITYSAPATNQVINIPTLPGYVAGKTDLTVTINSGVYVYATSTANSGLSLTGGKAAGDTVTVVNNGYIAGQGGNGVNTAPSGNPGGPAFSISSPIILTNNSYIGGGGGGGGGEVPSPINNSPGAGGGAGGGNGAPAGYQSSPTPGSVFLGSGGAGGYAGSAGTPGAPIPTPIYGTYTIAGQGGGAGGGSGSREIIARGTSVLAGGGGGGSIFPGTGGSGGGSQAPVTNPYPGVAGGAGNSVGGGNVSGVAGGGGGWGAAGGTGQSPAAPACQSPGGTGGKAINLNGNTITYPALGTIWGAVS